jgi:hypothetical protein
MYILFLFFVIIQLIWLVMVWPKVKAVYWSGISKKFFLPDKIKENMATSFSTAGDFLQKMSDIPMVNVTHYSTSTLASIEVDETQNTDATVEGHHEYLQQLERVVSIVVPIFFSIVVFVGLFGNLLVNLMSCFISKKLFISYFIKF